MNRPTLVETPASDSAPQGGGERRHRALFIAGAGTEIGKTYATAALTRSLRAAGRPVLALKPLASGVPPIDHPGFADSDTAILLRAQGLPVTAETVEACSPWRFLAPLAPDQAAAREGRALALGELVAWCERRLTSPRPLGEGDRAQRGGVGSSRSETIAPPPPSASRPPPPEGEVKRSRTLDEGVDGNEVADDTTILIEGVGGLMSPITVEATGLDWLKALHLPALLVAGSYLGAISHALTAIETLAAHGVPLAGVVVSESLDAPTAPEVVAEAIGRRIAAPVEILRRGGGFADSAARFV